MAFEAKAVLLNDFERDLYTKITASDLTKVLSSLSDVLSNYDVTSTNDQPDKADDLLDAYLSALSVQGRSQKTIERYQYLLSKMRKALGIPTRSITVYHLRKYLADEKTRGLSERTLESMRQVFSAYFNWLQRESLIESNPCANLGAIKYPKKEKDIYTDVDLERLKFCCKTLRDRAIVYFLLATGCRISEMTQLNRDSINFNTLECIVVGKGNKERTVYIDTVTGMALQNYLEQRTDDLPALFIGKGSERMTPHGIRKMLVELGQRAHVTHVHPHKFRRTRATTLIRHGMGLQEVAAILGHDKLDTTMQYVVLDKSDIKASYRKYA